MLKHGQFAPTEPLQQQAQDALATAPLLGLGAPPQMQPQGSAPAARPGASLAGGTPVTNNLPSNGQ
jgi:hypothetical protein